MQLLPEAVHIVKLNAKAGGTSWTGSLTLPRGCGTPAACAAQFFLSTSRVSLSDVNEWLNPKSKKRPWYRVLALGSDSRPAWWTSLHANGRISADRFQVRGIEATHMSSSVSLEDGKLRLSGLNADLFEGMHHGDWKVDFAKAPAVCTGTGNLAGVSLAAIASAMNDGWVSGTANASYEVKGPCPAEFWQAGIGKLHVEVQDGVFPHVLIAAGTQALRASLIKGEAQLHGGEIEITNTQFISPEVTYQLSGTASLKHEVDLRLTRISSDPAVGYTIGGTLEAPRVAPLSRTEQARLGQ